MCLSTKWKCQCPGQRAPRGPSLSREHVPTGGRHRPLRPACACVCVSLCMRACLSMREGERAGGIRAFRFRANVHISPGSRRLRVRVFRQLGKLDHRQALTETGSDS